MDLQSAGIEKSRDEIFIDLFVSALQGSATTAATRHDTQAPLLVKKALEIAKLAIEELKNV
jgi:hypothetical protein